MKTLGMPVCLFYILRARRSYPPVAFLRESSKYLDLCSIVLICVVIIMDLIVTLYYIGRNQEIASKIAANAPSSFLTPVVGAAPSNLRNRCIHRET